MKEIIINTNSGGEFYDGMIKYSKKLLKSENYNYYIDEMIDILERNKIQFHNGIMLAEIMKNVDFNTFEYHKKDELFTKLVNRYYVQYNNRMNKLSAQNGESYWTMEFVIKLVKKDSYNFLIDVVKGNDNIEVRANALKRLAIVSGQHFDRNLPKDPGHWKEKDLRIDELNKWIENGCKDGVGYCPPKQDKSLFNPTNQFEEAVSKLNKKLIKEQDNNDYSNYDNFLIVPNDEELNKVLEKYKIQGIYLEFLKRFSPSNTIIPKGMCEISLYGVDNIIENQIGYSVDIVNNIVEDWPSNYLVIADKFADPYCIDITIEDSKVYHAKHGEGSWKFKKAYNNFIEFLEYLAK